MECKKVACHSHGDHTIIIGEVLDAKEGGGPPLLYYRSSYARIKTPVKTAQL